MAWRAVVTAPATFFAPSPIALFDDNLGDGLSRLMSEPVEILCCTSPDTLTDTLARIEAAQAAGHWVAIAAAYELGYVLEPRLAPQRPASDTPLLQAWVFARCDAFDNAATDTWLNAQDSAQPTGLIELEAQLSRKRYLAAIGQIKAYIADGDCYQANFTFAFSARAFGDPYRLYQRLRAAQPVHYGALILHPDGCLMSRSPELFVHRRGDTLTCKPMKGTAPIDEPPSALTASEKNRA
jgi:para-aminobenzoate synthetase / 4-amino-4-deoxychorismate lyase